MVFERTESSKENTIICEKLFLEQLFRHKSVDVLRNVKFSLELYHHVTDTIGIKKKWANKQASKQMEIIVMHKYNVPLHFCSLQLSYGQWAITIGTSNRAFISQLFKMNKWLLCTGTLNMHTVYTSCARVDNTYSIHGPGPLILVLGKIRLMMPMLL